MRQYNKLVRDKVPAIMLAAGHKSVTRTLQGSELLSALRAKLDEEISEYDASPDDQRAALELADIVEVIMAIAKKRGFDEATISQLRQAKALQRGGFDRGFFLLKAE